MNPTFKKSSNTLFILVISPGPFSIFRYVAFPLPVSKNYVKNDETKEKIERVR